MCVLSPAYSLTHTSKKIKLLSSEVERLRDDFAESNATVKSWMQMLKDNYNALHCFVNDLSEMPEFKKLKQKMIKEKERLHQEAAVDS